MRKLKPLLQSKYLFKILTIIIIIISIFFTKFKVYHSKYSESETSFIGSITKISFDDKKVKLEIKGKEKLIVIYNSQDEKLKKLSYGDTVKVEGKLTLPSSSTIPNTFDYQKYLYNKKIYYIVKATSITKIKNNDKYLYTIKKIIYKRIEKLKSSKYLKTFILSDTNEIDGEVKSNYRNLGISHLFSISGMHISIFTSVIYFYLDKITHKKQLKYIIVDIFLTLYLLLLGCPPSLLRSTIMYLLFTLNKIFKLKISSTDLLLLSLIIILIINPFILYNIGFEYSFIITFFLITFSSKIKNDKKISKFMTPIFLSFIASIPLNLYYNYEINFLSLIMNIVFVPFISLIIFPLSLLTFIFPVFDDFLFHLVSILEIITTKVGNIKFLTVIFVRPSILIVILYYLVIIFILLYKKYWYLFLIIITIHKFSPYFNSNFELVMFDVGQADCLLINLPHNKGHIMIDTGSTSDSYSVMTFSIIPYLKSRGITKIDNLLITHGDEDHIGGALSLIKNCKVKKVILNKGDFTDYETELIRELSLKKIPFNNNQDQIKLKNFTIYLLNNKIFDSENDNSIVAYFVYNNYRFLMMGDSSKTTEDYLLQKYNLTNISFLKVGHHGSSTSSSPSFIERVNPKVSLVSVGQNFYGHPSPKVLDILNSSLIYRTDENGTVTIKIKRKRCYISTTKNN